MLWNLRYLENEEKTNPDYKQLIDNLRTFGLYPYYLSRKYRKVAIVELNKVDWTNQTKRIRNQYEKPLLVLKVHALFKRIGSYIKQIVFRII